VKKGDKPSFWKEKEMKRSVAIILMLALCVGGFFALPALKQEPPMPDAAMDVLGVPGDTTIATVNGTPSVSGSTVSGSPILQTR
jgi:hypothetical protein